jgi:hypothetical protein
MSFAGRGTRSVDEDESNAAGCFQGQQDLTESRGFIASLEQAQQNRAGNFSSEVSRSDKGKATWLMRL